MKYCINDAPSAVFVSLARAMGTVKRNEYIATRNFGASFFRRRQYLSAHPTIHRSVILRLSVDMCADCLN